MLKSKDLREQSLPELEEAYKQASRRLFNLKNQKATQKSVEKPHETKHARKDIARLLTIISEKHKEQQNPSR